MSLLNQKTLNSSVKFNGVGLHTGKEVSINILPSEPNTGILFKRIDLENNNIVIPNLYNVSNATLCTTISNEYGASVSTIEHLMGAFYGLGIDNALIEINSQEIPILDGSAKNFVEKFLEVGFKVSEVPIKLIKILNKVIIEDGSKYIEIDKSNVSLDIDFEIKYMKSLIGSQKNKINVYENDLSEIYNSRTFCLYEDVEKLRNIGLAKGGSLDNAIVVKGNKVLNDEGLRNKLEFVNHKILDCMGDLYLSGYKIIGSLKCSQGGHSLTNKLLREVFKDKNNYSIFEIKEKSLPHAYINKSVLKSIA
jgi:UDP-3-O-[3-hydroxymyristoyl] N-acetylglucosamine deacetylase